MSDILDDAYMVYDRGAAKKPANVSVNADLLAKAKAMGINLSATLEAALARELRERRRAAWLRDNADAIGEYNGQVDREGVFGDTLRSF